MNGKQKFLNGQKRDIYNIDFHNKNNPRTFHQDHHDPGLARPERIELAIQKCSELGAVKFIPVISERVQGGNSGTPSPQRLKRWQRIAIESAELSRGSFIPFNSTTHIVDGGHKPKTLEKGRIPCMWEESSDESKSLKAALKFLKKHPDGLTALIGPPGGFSQKEALSIQATGAQL
ncbi:MAG: hypothetical protein Ct9H300mP19_13530 [Dehalococcoidia bacterium]|nr:MAG: hypothetical protein Ct9H300mP19_13530 [Dehalococcoidia bacterium]